MSDKFLNPSGSGNSDITNGSVNAYLSSLTLDSLTASMPIKTNSVNTLVSSKLDIADINNLQTTINSTLRTPYTGTIEATDFETSDYLSVNQEIQKIDNFTASTQAPEVSNLTGLLNVGEVSTGRVYDLTSATFIDLGATDINVSSTNLTFNGNELGQKDYNYMVGADNTYATIQAAIDAVEVDAVRSTIFINEGTYLNSLTASLNAEISLMGSSKESVILEGKVQYASVNQTQNIGISNMSFKNTTGVAECISFVSTGAGDFYLENIDIFLDATPTIGILYNKPNGTLYMNNVRIFDAGVASSGIILTAGNIVMRNCVIGSTTNTAITCASGSNIDIENCLIRGTITTTSAVFKISSSSVLGTITINDTVQNGLRYIYNCNCANIVLTSSSLLNINNCKITNAGNGISISTNSEVRITNTTIDTGSSAIIGDGTYKYQNITYLSNSTIAGTLTKATLGTATFNNIETTTITPNTTSVSDIGTTALKYKDLHLSGAVNTNTAVVDTTLTIGATNFNNVDVYLPAVFTSTAVCACSLRLVVSTYTGNCAEVRRGGDGVALDIGFVNGILDETAFNAHIAGGGGDGRGYCRTLYDQTGNGNNFIQASGLLNPEIIFTNGIPELVFDGTRYMTNTTNTTTLGMLGNYALSTVFKSTSPTGQFIYGGGDAQTYIGPNNNIGIQHSTTNNFTIATPWDDGTYHTLTDYQSGTTGFIRYDNILSTIPFSAIPVSSGVLNWGNNTTTNTPFNGSMNEIIIWSTAPSVPDIEAIQNEQNALWNTQTPSSQYVSTTGKLIVGDLESTNTLTSEGDATFKIPAGQNFSITSNSTPFASVYSTVDSSAITSNITMKTKNIEPITTATYDLGSLTLNYRDLFLSRGATLGGRLLYDVKMAEMVELQTTTTNPTSTWIKVNFISTALSYTNGFTNPSVGRLTYTGADRLMFHTGLTFTIEPPTVPPYNNNVYDFAIFKNGLLLNGSLVSLSVDGSNNEQSTAIHKFIGLQTNDYIEFYCRNASGGSQLFTCSHFNFFVMSMAMTYEIEKPIGTIALTGYSPSGDYYNNSVRYGVASTDVSDNYTAGITYDGFNIFDNEVGSPFQWASNNFTGASSTASATYSLNGINCSYVQLTISEKVLISSCRIKAVSVANDRPIRWRLLTSSDNGTTWSIAIDQTAGDWTWGGNGGVGLSTTDTGILTFTPRFSNKVALCITKCLGGTVMSVSELILA